MSGDIEEELFDGSEDKILPTEDNDPDIILQMKNHRELGHSMYTGHPMYNWTPGSTKEEEDEDFVSSYKDVKT